MQESSWKFKEEVAETAISLFKRDGYNNVTVNDICKACGISRSVFYSSFNGKRSILEYMVEKPQHNDDASFMKFAHADNDFERIWQLFDRFITIAYDFGPELTSTLFIMQFESPEGIRAAVHRSMICLRHWPQTVPSQALSTRRSRRICCRASRRIWSAMSSMSGAVKRATSRCARVRGSMQRSPTTSSRNTACRPNSGMLYDLQHTAAA